MTNLVYLPNSAGIRRAYINGTASNTISNTTTETLFDQTFQLQAQNVQSVVPNSVIRLQAWGVISTGLAAVGSTFRVRWNGVSGTAIAQSTSLSVASGLSDSGWWADCIIRITQGGSPGSAECQCVASFQGSALTSTTVMPMPNTTGFATDFNQLNEINFSWQWGLALGTSSIQLRALFAEVIQP